MTPEEWLDVTPMPRNSQEALMNMNTLPNDIPEYLKTLHNAWKFGKVADQYIQRFGFQMGPELIKSQLIFRNKSQWINVVDEWNQKYVVPQREREEAQREEGRRIAREYKELGDRAKTLVPAGSKVVVITQWELKEYEGMWYVGSTNKVDRNMPKKHIISLKPMKHAFIAESTSGSRYVLPTTVLSGRLV